MRLAASPSVPRNGNGPRAGLTSGYSPRVWKKIAREARGLHQAKSDATREAGEPGSLHLGYRRTGEAPAVSQQSLLKRGTLKIAGADRSGGGQLRLIKPVEPNQAACMESFSDCPRAEFLHEHWFSTCRKSVPKSNAGGEAAARKGQRRRLAACRHERLQGSLQL